MIADDEDFEILDRAAASSCWPRCRSGGWPGITPDSRVNIRPVNYTLAGADVVVRTGMGSILAAAQGNLPVTFEADDLEPCLRAGWSVLVIGTAESLGSTSEAARLRASVHPWARGTRENVLRIRAREITGRRLHPQTGTMTVVHLGSDAEG